jgi:hypothetical protein
VNRNSTNKSRRAANLTWRAMDLHIHTPASSDYHEPDVTYLDILRTAEARGMDIIAFTDHNTVAGYRGLRDEISALELLERLGRLMPDEAERLAEYRRLLNRMLLLPGFEFTATFGFHILGIFPPDMPVRALEHLLLSLNVPPEQLDKGSATVGATTDVLTAYRRVAESGGLAIAAHANSTSGVAMRGFGFGGQTKIAFTQDVHLCALEVTDLDQKGRRTTAAFFSGSKPEYPRRMHCITGSDAHRLSRDPQNSKNLGIGERATDVLLEDVSFEALKALFAGSDFARIRPHVADPALRETAFDYVQQAREEGANIVQAFHESMAQRGGRLHAVVADVCAFANTNGGTVYVGATADPRQPPAGIQNPDQAVRELRSAIARMITPQLNCTVDLLTSRGKKVVRILVPRGDDVPYAIEDNKIYVREEAETSLAVRDEIVQLVLRGRSTERAPAPAEAEAPSQGGRQASTAEPIAPAAPADLPAEGTAVTPPRTGVEIVATELRDGTQYHTMRDLRNNSVVKNVTRTSARKLWHYAITTKEDGTLKPEAVSWQGNIGLWRRTHKGGATRYDLVQRTNGELHVYYGVTEDGIHGPWKHLVEREERRAVASHLPAAPAISHVAPASHGEPAPAHGPETDETPQALLPEPMVAQAAAIELPAEPDAEAQEPVPGLELPAEMDVENGAMPARKAARKRSRKTAKKASTKATKTQPASRKSSKSAAGASKSTRSRTRSSGAKSAS